MALKSIEHRYEAENELLKAVSAGNMDEAMQCIYRFSRFRLLPRVPSPIRDRKNLMITLNTLLRKAAEAGGVNPLHIDNLSRQLAIQIESALTLEQLEGIDASMARKYCILVKNYSRRPYSSMVQTCLDYVDFYFSQDLSLSSMAKLCSVSESHLSTTFKKEVGMTLTDYINNTRIRQALLLLNTTALSVSEVALRCGFSDANYFSRIFKKLLGQTPRQYRDNIRKRME